MASNRIPSSRTSKCAGIEIGVEAFERLARRVRDGGAGAEGLDESDRRDLSYHITWEALQLQKQATRALRGQKW